MQFFRETKAATRLACKSLWRLLFFAKQVVFVIGFCAGGFSFCTPARDTVMRDVERNYASTGFLDTDTFQVRCPLEAEGDRLGRCKKTLVGALVAFKESFDRTAHARSNHPDFQPFLKPIEVTDEKRTEWGSFYEELARDRARLVFESRTPGTEVFEGVYRLRQKDLIYRVQNAR